MHFRDRDRKARNAKAAWTWELEDSLGCVKLISSKQNKWIKKEREKKTEKEHYERNSTYIGWVKSKKKSNSLLRENLDADITSDFYRFYFLLLCDCELVSECVYVREQFLEVGFLLSSEF